MVTELDGGLAPELSRECACGAYIITNDPYMADEFDGPEGWHSPGAFLAGQWHGPRAQFRGNPQ